MSRPKAKYKTKSIRAIYYSLWKKGTKINQIQLAELADKIIQTERLAWLNLALEALNLNLIHKNDITPHEYAKSPKIVILNRSYALIKKTTS